MNLNEMIETEQKCYMVNCLAEIRDAISSVGGVISNATPYSEYAGIIQQLSGKVSKYNIGLDTILGNTSADSGLILPIKSGEVDFSGVKYIASQALMYKFYNCNINSVNFPDLERLHTPSAMEGAFYQCSLSSVTFPKLKEISGAYALKLAFARNIHLESVSFPVLEDLGMTTNQFDDMLSGITGCTVHFPASMEATISVLDSAIAGFGGTDTEILYDL